MTVSPTLADWHNARVLSHQTGEVTRLLTDWREGNEAALAQLMPIIYQELRKLATAYLRRERLDHTLQPTALVHEAYVRLVDQRVPSFNGRSHFFGIAARLMRQILVDFARSRQTAKRDEGLKAPLEDAMAVAEAPAVALLDLNDALERLAAVNQRHAKVIELRYFGGLSRGEVAEVLDISLARVKRDIAEAEAWLRAELTPPA